MGRTHLLFVGDCLPDPHCALQIGGSPLHFAAASNDVKKVKEFLEAKVAQTATDKVRGGMGLSDAHREGSRVNTHLSSVFSFLFDMRPLTG